MDQGPENAILHQMHQCLGNIDIDLIGREWIEERIIQRNGREIKNDLDIFLFHHRLHRPQVPGVIAVNDDPPRIIGFGFSDVAFLAEEEIVDDDDLFRSRSQQRIRQMRSDKAGSAGDEYVFPFDISHIPPSLILDPAG